MKKIFRELETLTTTLTQQITNTPEKMRLWQQERTILDLTELICEIMKEQNVDKTELALRLGKSKGYITRILDGQINITIRVISDIFTALNKTIHFKSKSL